MDNNKRNIDDFFRKEMADAAEMPPQPVWDALEQRLDNDRPLFLWKLGGSIVVLLVGGGIAAYYLTRTPLVAPLPATHTIALQQASGRNNAHIRVNEPTVDHTGKVEQPLMPQRNQGQNDGLQSVRNAGKPKRISLQPTTIRDKEYTKTFSDGNTIAKNSNSLSQGIIDAESNPTDQPDHAKPILQDRTGAKGSGTELIPEKDINSTNADADALMAHKEPHENTLDTLYPSTPDKPLVAPSKRDQALQDNSTLFLSSVTDTVSENHQQDIPGIKTEHEKDPKHKQSLSLSIAAKAGYEYGTRHFTAGKYVGSVSASVQVSNRWSILLQPGIKVAKLNQSYSRITGNYYQAGPTTSALLQTRFDTVLQEYRYDYAYKQVYDSMIASKEAKRNFVAFELPVFVQYKINPRLSLMAGVNVTFGKGLQWKNKLYTLSGLTLTDTLLNSLDTTAPAAADKFLHQGSMPFSGYNPSLAPKSKNPVYFGYSFGMSYNLKKKLMLDLLIQQNVSGYNRIAETELRQVFAQPYIRLSVGYTLFYSGKK